LASDRENTYACDTASEESSEGEKNVENVSLSNGKEAQGHFPGGGREGNAKRSFLCHFFREKKDFYNAVGKDGGAKEVGLGSRNSRYPRINESRGGLRRAGYTEEKKIKL